MPEGDTIFRAARTLHRALAGGTVVHFESAYPALNRINDDQPLTGRIVESVTSRGKHLLIAFSGSLVLHTHMRMNGSWHVYRPGERWQRARDDMRVVVGTSDFVAVGFNIPVAEFLSPADVARHPQLRALGPDLAGDGFDREAVLRRMRAAGDTAIGDLLLDQRVLAGIGNVLKSEILFVAGIDPFTPARNLSDESLGRMMEISRRMMKMNITETAGGGRRTTGRLDPSQKLWIYGRAGRPCRKCGNPIRSRRTGPEARLTYWCPSCQR